MRRRLIINGDDLGRAPGTVDVIAALHQAGTITSTTAMATQPSWPDAAACLLALLDALHPGVTESLVHPSTRGWSAGDFRALFGSRIRRRIENLGIEPITYADLDQYIACSAIDAACPPTDTDARTT